MLPDTFVRHREFAEDGNVRGGLRHVPTGPWGPSDAIGAGLLGCGRSPRPPPGDAPPPCAEGASARFTTRSPGAINGYIRSGPAVRWAGPARRRLTRHYCTLARRGTALALGVPAHTKSRVSRSASRGNRLHSSALTCPTVRPPRPVLFSQLLNSRRVRARPSPHRISGLRLPRRRRSARGAPEACWRPLLRRAGRGRCCGGCASRR